MRTDPRFEKWRDRWLKAITDDVYNLNVDRDIFTNVLEIVKKNDRIDKNSAFFGFFIQTYVYSVVMGIRRQLKTDKDSISLIGLLTEIAENSELVTRLGFYALYDGKLSGLPYSVKEEMMKESFNEFAEPTSPHIDCKLVQNDIASLKNICNSVEDYADKRIAHWDRKQPLNLTLDEVFIALDSLVELVKRYQFLFFAHNIDMRHHPQLPIYHVFEEPWISPNMPETK